MGYAAGLWTSIIILAKMLYQMEFFNHESLSFVCTVRFQFSEILKLEIGTFVCVNNGLMIGGFSGHLWDKRHDSDSPLGWAGPDEQHFFKYLC